MQRKYAIYSGVFWLIWLIGNFIPCTAERPLPPHITKQVPPDEILFQVALPNENEKPFIIECEADGDPPPEYYWIKNGKDFAWQTYDDRISQQPGRGSLVITKPRDEDIGQYQCFARNKWGTATSNSVFVRKAELNTFREEPVATVKAKEGDPHQFVCHPPDGWPKPIVNWIIQATDGAIRSINSSRITLDPEGNLWFSNVTRQDNSDDFTYTCIANSPFRRDLKLGTQIALRIDPTGTSPGQNKRAPVQQYVTRKQEIALRDKTVQLFCIFGGTPLPQTVWFKNGRPLQVSDRVSQGNYGKSLVIKHVTVDDEGDYTCEVSNGVGDARSYSINLKVLSVPYFTEEPEVVNAAEGETAVIRCNASGVPEPQIQWIFNGKHIALAPPNNRRTVNTNMITIEKLQTSDIGNYGCNATNSLGYVYKDVYVNVLAVEPEISSPPRDEETVDGKDVKLLCRVNGVPKPEVKWIRNGIELTGGRYTILQNGDLLIRNVAFTDMGQYMCNARNKLGEASASGNLTVRQRTQITKGLGPKDYEVKAGTPATFHCSAQTDESLALDIHWLRNGEIVDFQAEPRFVKSNDYSLTITQTIELDSGVYTCLAKTRLDEATAQATLIVQDVPNPPKLESVVCNLKDASIKWQPMGDNRAPILTYVIQYNTSFTKDVWDNVFDSVPAADTSYIVPLTPWANYTFRVLAKNKVGISLPSTHSSVCKTESDIPYKNPDNVEGKGTKPDNLVIMWTPMPEIEHHAPRFHYQVSWKRDIPGSNWASEDVLDWRVNKKEIPNQPTFQPYIVKVTAINERGVSAVPPKEVLGYSGEDAPTEAPTNLTLIAVLSATAARISWFPVHPESIRGHFKGYKVQAWSERDQDREIREMTVDRNTTTDVTIDILVPYSKNYVRVLAYNGGYNGPPSDIMPVTTPEGIPGPVQSLTAVPLSSSGFYLKWKPPLQPNGILTGYRIYYQSVVGTDLGPLLERKPQIVDPNQSVAKLTNLQPATKYRIYINATTSAGEGGGYFIEPSTRSTGAIQPNKPGLTWTREYSSEIYPSVRINWLPDERKPGSHFFTKYRIEGETVWLINNGDPNEHYTVIRGLEPDKVYEFRVVSVDGHLQSESESVLAELGMENKLFIARENIITAGWFVGMVLALAFLIIILILVCLVRRNRGGKYIVHEQEAAHRRHDYPEEPGFHEYSQPLGGGGGAPRTRDSVSSDKKQHPESDTDSMVDAEADTEGMNEDGSFIGLYGKQQKRQGETSSSGGFATLV